MSILIIFLLWHVYLFLYYLGEFELFKQARSSQLNKLELRFRPEDPYSHPAFGVPRECTNLLLKISKKKCSNGQTAEASGKLQECSTSGATVSENPTQPSQVEEQRPEQEKTNLFADIVSRVSKAYHFDGRICVRLKKKNHLIIALKFEIFSLVKEWLIINMLLLFMRTGKEREIWRKQRNHPLVRSSWLSL